MIGGVIRRGLPHLPGVSHLHVNRPQIFKKLITRKPKRNHWAYKEWAPSLKLLQQNMNRIVHAKVKLNHSLAKKSERKKKLRKK